MIDSPSTKAVDNSTTLAADHTRLAFDRTLLAWIRTAISLITFGFTIYKFFQLELARVAPRPERLIGPREFAFLMILVGLVSLLIATLEHRRDLKALRAQSRQNSAHGDRACGASFGPRARGAGRGPVPTISIAGAILLVAECT